MFLKTLQSLISRTKKEIGMIFVLGTIVSLSEVLLVSNVLDIYDFLLSANLTSVQSQSILILAYVVAIFLGLIMVYFAKYTAFKVAFGLCIQRTLSDSKLDFVNNESALNNLMTIERERLSREILAPLFVIFSKIALPIVSVLIILRTVELSFWSIAVPLIALIGVFTTASSFFAKFARKLEIILRVMGSKLTEFVRMFTSHARLSSFDYGELRIINHDLAVLEGKIDSVSQLPRQAIDVGIMIMVVLTATGSLTNVSLSVLVSVPLLVRSLSYFQAIYKAFASLRSNIMALSVMRLMQEEQPDKVPFRLERRVVLKYYSENSELVDADTDCRYRCVGLKYPSGYGKSNAILNLLYGTDIFPSRIDLQIINLENDNIGFITSEPYFSENLCQSAGDKDLLYPEKFLPLERSPLKASAGEKFRWALIQELNRDVRLLVIDESIVSLPAEQRDQVFELCMNRPNPVCLMIVSHSDDILSLCDKVFGINE